MKAMAGCRLSLAMTSRPLGVTIPTLEFPTAPFRGRGRCRRWHQGWICPIVRWIESGLMNGAAGSMVHGGKLYVFFIMLPRAADAQCPGNTGSRCTQPPHPQKPTSKERMHELTTNYRISEGQTEGWACSDFKIQRKLKYLINWSMSAPLQKYELSSMKWASNGELSTHDIHKLLSKMSQAQAIDRQTQCLEPIEIPK